MTISRDGQLLYSKTSKFRPVQVQIIFDSQTSADSREIELITKSYYLKNSAEFIYLADKSLQTTTMSGRLPQDTCLSAAFGDEFRGLLKTPQVVGIVWGCAARIFKAIICSNSGFDRDIERDWRSYNDAASGLGFVENTVKWFPGLSSLRKHIETGAKMNLMDAKTHYEQNLSMIESRCPCGNYKSEAFVEGYTFYLATLFETIITLSHALASFIITESIYPSKAGLELFYIKQRR